MAANEEIYGVIRQAMAYRVKYRITDTANPCRIQTSQMGVHNCNRAGVYPQFDRVRGLGNDLLDWGFSAEEADHVGVCVQEVPASELAKLAVAGAYETYTSYNLSKCNGTQLEGCFKEEEHISYGTLSHSHLLLVLRSMISGARWDLKDGEDKPKCCKNGKLDIDAVAAKDPTYAHYCLTGLKMEVLSYKINIEEPNACRLISQALNKASEACLQTTELIALSVLSGEVTRAANSAVAESVALGTVQTKLRAELDFVVDDPAFLELYEFVISMGANKNSFIEGLLAFGAKYVDGKKRRLRLEAFATINKIGDAFPRLKIATLKRAYRKKPYYGFYPAPDAQFHMATPENKMRMEELLRYFHVTCPPAVAAFENTEADIFERTLMLLQLNISRIRSMT